jgi:hypothetical protein
VEKYGKTDRQQTSLLLRKEILCMSHNEGKNTEAHNFEYLLLSNWVILPDSRKMICGNTFKN